MKKITTIIILFFALTNGYAQFTSASFTTATANDYNGIQKPPAKEYRYNVNTKAMRNFYDNYGDSKNESWYSTDYGFRAKFSYDNVSFMADYNKKGQWLVTFKTYDENKLPKDIRHKVKQEYYDYRIFRVQEINKPDETIYLISQENNSSWMTLRVAGDYMETAAVYNK